jgi:hypothetical protein
VQLIHRLSTRSDKADTPSTCMTWSWSSIIILVGPCPSPPQLRNLPSALLSACLFLLYPTHSGTSSRQLGTEPCRTRIAMWFCLCGIIDAGIDVGHWSCAISPHFAGHRQHITENLATHEQSRMDMPHLVMRKWSSYKKTCTYEVLPN